MVVIPEIRIEIKPSLFLSGEVGLFAARDIKKGDIVIASNAYDASHSIFYPWAEFDSLDALSKRKVFDFGLGNDKGTIIPVDFNKVTIEWYMNHRCDYNVGFNRQGDFLAVRDIKAGEELCWDYGLGEANPSFRLECKCGSFNCRKLITGNDWKDETYRKANAEYMFNGLLK